MAVVDRSRARDRLFRTFCSASLLAALGLTACVHRPPRWPDVAERAEAEAALADFRAYWLAPARVAPPTIPTDPRTVTDGGYVVTLRPVRAEDERWNQWRDGEYRLFNNRAAYLFEVEIEGPGPLRWIPERSWIELNGDEEATLPAAGRPDDLLVPLLGAALEQERWLAEGDLVERTRAAGAFRAAYLAQGPSPALSGVVAFPLQRSDLHVVKLRVVLTVSGGEGTRPIVAEFD